MYCSDYNPPPSWFVKSAFAPVKYLPGWLYAFAEHQPVSLKPDSVRGLLLNQPDFSLT
ncbi:MAG TPA: hypothetical protein VJ785_19665 [Anaerolineales bacterium]|nr:hypothetical protein [Anaerolineales bacterium]